MAVEALRDLMSSNDRRYLELFAAADKATQTAMVAAEKAINAAMVAAEKAVQAALAASEKAVAKAEENQLRVNEGQNEFRAQLKDQASTLASKEAVDALDRRVQVIERNAVSEGALESLDRRTQALEKSSITKEMYDALSGRLSVIESNAVTRNAFEDKFSAQDHRKMAEHDTINLRLANIEKSAAFTAGGPSAAELARQLKAVEAVQSVATGRSSITTALWALAGSVLVAVLITLVLKFVTK